MPRPRSLIEYRERIMRYEPLEDGHFDRLYRFSEELRADPTPCLFWSLNEERLLAWQRDELRTTLIGLVDDDIACIGALQQGGRHQQHLGELSIAVHPDQRRDRHAACTVATLEAHAHAMGIEVLKALIWVENEPSRRLFDKLGYEHKATLMAEFKDGDQEIDDAVYYKRL